MAKRISKWLPFSKKKFIVATVGRNKEKSSPDNNKEIGLTKNNNEISEKEFWPTFINIYKYPKINCFFPLQVGWTDTIVFIFITGIRQTLTDMALYADHWY